MSKNTNWKNLGRKQGATMKNFRNMKADKMMYNDGKWSTVYSDDDIKRLAYYNIDLPHVVGIGTNTPFSRLSFGDSSNSGDHVSGKLNPGKLASIALHEKTVQEEDLDIKRGQEFNGIGYVSKLRSVRSNIINTDANGVGIFSNKFISATDSSQKTDKAIMYITDDKHVQIGGVPTGYKLIDRTINGSFISETQETGPNIILDVSGSIHINGFINFLKKGANFPTPTQENDNPANQLTLDVESEPQQIKLCNTSDQTKTTNRAVPEGAIFVGFDKDPNSNTLSTDPRLYIMVGGEQKRIATEDDKEFYEENDGGFNFTGSNGIEGGSITTYVFRNPDDRPGNTLINTFVGITGDDFDGVIGGRNLPQTYDGNTLAPETSALQVLGNISVFDSKYGGTDLSPLNTGNLEKARQILVTEIYDNTSLENNPGRELGTVYTDRHIMIGGQKYSTNSTTPNLTFSHFGSAIDISGGITGKPAIRLISGSNNGSIKSSNPKDSIIIGDTDKDNFKTMNKECILVGKNDKYENNENTLVMGNTNTVKNTKNSLIVGNNLDVSFNSVTEGVVVLGVGDNNLEVNGDDRIVFATNDGTNSMKALTIDLNGNVTIKGDLEVEGEHVHLEVQHLVAKDAEIELNAVRDGTSSKGAAAGDGGGLCLFTTEHTTDNVKFSYDSGNSRWTTKYSSSSTGLAAADDSFKVLNNGDLQISSDGTSANNKFTVEASSGHVDMSGNLHIHGTGGITLENNKTITNTTANTVVINGEVAAGTDSATGVFKSNGNQDVTLRTGNGTSGSITITDDANGDITIAPNGSGTLKINSDFIIDNTNVHTIIDINGGYAAGKGATFDISKNNAGNPVTNLKITGKLTVDGDIDPTGLVLEGTPGDYSSYTNKLVLYNDLGTLKYKVGSTEKEIAISGGSGTIGGTIEFANDLKIASSKNKVVYQEENNKSTPLDFGAAGTYLKTGSANTAPTFAKISADDLDNGTTNKFFTETLARGAISVTDSGGDGSLTYNSSSGVITYTGPSASEARAHISVTDSGGDGSLAYNSSTGVITYTGPSASEARAHISVTDSGGDGSLAYNSSSGVITYTGPSASEARAHFSPGTGVTITNGQIGIAQDISTNSTPTFNGITLNQNGQQSRTISVGQTTGVGVGTELILKAGKGLASTGGSVQTGGNISIEGGDASSVSGITNKGNVNITGTNVNITGILKADTIESKGTKLKLTTEQNGGIYLNAQGEQNNNNRYPILINGAPLFKMATTIHGFNNLATSDQPISAKNLINGRLISNYNRPSNGTLGFMLPPVTEICNLIDELAGVNSARDYSFKFIWDTTQISNSQSARLKVPASGQYSYVGRGGSTGSVEINIPNYFEQFDDRVQEYTCLIKTWTAGTPGVGSILIMEPGFGSVVNGQIA